MKDIVPADIYIYIYIYIYISRIDLKYKTVIVRKKLLLKIDLLHMIIKNKIQSLMLRDMSRV
jgi:hypothetical protein